MLSVTSILLLAVVAVNSQVPRDYHYYNEAPKPYSFNYNAVLEDGIGQISRTETQDASGRVQGSYSLANDEGHTRIVDYVADENGFRAHVRTNEPGTDNENPADVIFESSSPYANRNFHHYSTGGRPVARRPVLNAAVGGPEPVAPEVAPIDGLSENVLPRRPPVRRPAPAYRNRPAVRNPFGRY